MLKKKIGLGGGGIKGLGGGGGGIKGLGGGNALAKKFVKKDTTKDVGDAKKVTPPAEKKPENDE